MNMSLDPVWAGIDMDSIELSDITGDAETITISDYHDSFSVGNFTVDTITLGDYTPSVTIGNITLTEEKVETFEALIEAINNLPEDNELRTMFESVLILKKIKK